MKNKKIKLLTVVLCIMALCATVLFASCGESLENTPTETTAKIETKPITEPVTEPETEPTTSEGLEFTSNGDGTCYVSGIGTCTDTDIVVPEKSPAGDTVTAIGNGYVSGKYTGFYKCSKITSVVIPASVTSIGYYAFAGCSSLTSIDIPASVTSIKLGAFSSCSSLTSITVAEGNTVYHSAGNCIIETESKTLIAGCGNSVIPDDGSVTSIGNQAFYGCSSLTSIEIPASVTSIGYEAFSGCSNLQYNTYSNAQYLGNSVNPYLALIKSNDACIIHPQTKIIAGEVVRFPLADP